MKPPNNDQTESIHPMNQREVLASGLAASEKTCGSAYYRYLSVIGKKANAQIVCCTTEYRI
jgi:hypothetical protein